jgi:hypothetical protein
MAFSSRILEIIHISAFRSRAPAYTFTLLLLYNLHYSTNRVLGRYTVLHSAGVPGEHRVPSESKRYTSQRNRTRVSLVLNRARVQNKVNSL